MMSDPLFVGTATAAQVAERAGVSAPSVVRAARAVGFAGFTELKLEIARARGTTEFFAPPLELRPDAAPGDVLEASVAAGRDSLAALTASVDPVLLGRSIDAVREATRVLVTGAGTSAAVAADAAFRLRALGAAAFVVADHESARIAARLLDPGDVVLAVSATGRTATTLSVADAGSSSGAVLLAITNQHGTPLAQAADIALVVGGVPLPSQTAASGSRLAHLVVVDALVTGVALREPERIRRAERAGIDLPDLS